jgi:hypothetical protein
MQAELSRKLETEKEKVQPFYISTDMKLQEQKQNENDNQFLKTELSSTSLLSSSGLSTTNSSNSSSSSTDPWCALENFYKKYNRVLLDKLAITQEKQRLTEENNSLRNILKQYLDGVAITSDAVDHENPLLIINGRINLMETQVRRTNTHGRPAVTQEAALIIQQRQLVQY